MFLFDKAVINSLQNSSMATRGIVNDALQLYGEDIFMTRSVNEILWGYTDPALKTLKNILPKWFYTDYVGYFINVCFVKTIFCFPLF